MKESIFDKVVDKLTQRRDVIRVRLAQEYKRAKPFRKQEIPKQELQAAYQSLSLPDMQELIQKHGEDNVNSFIAEMEQLRDKEVLNAITKDFAKR